jgi:CRP-like cAMP-binding protein
MKNGAKAIGHRANRLLSALEPADFAWIEPHLEIVDLPKGKVIYKAGDTIGYTYFPHNTFVSLVTVLKDGGSVEVAVFGRESALGFVSALISRRSFGQYIVQVAGTASRISIEWLHQATGVRPKVRHLLLRFTEAMLTQSLQSVACNAVHSVEARCCRWILSTRDRMEQDTLPLTHELLAEMLGVQRSTVSSITRSLQMSGLIRQGRGVITITDQAGVEDTACECYEIIRQSFERLLPPDEEKV